MRDACGEMCAVVATRCEVDAVMIYTGDWIVVAADNTVCRQSSWWRNGCLRRMALAFSLCSTRLRDCWICKAHVFSSSPVRADFNLASSLNTLYASPPQPPPSASATRGTKMMPADSQSLCLQILPLEILILLNGSLPVQGGGSENLRAEAAGDGKVKGSG